MKKTLKIIDKTRTLLFIIAGVLVAGILFVSCGGYGGGGSGMYGGSGMAVAPGAFSLLAPADKATSVGTMPMLTWTASANAADYRVQIDTTGTFSGTLIVNTTVGMTTYSFTVPATANLQTGTTYFWRVIAENIYGMAIAGPRSFTP